MKREYCGINCFIVISGLGFRCPIRFKDILCFCFTIWFVWQTSNLDYRLRCKCTYAYKKKNIALTVAQIHILWCIGAQCSICFCCRSSRKCWLHMPRMTIYTKNMYMYIYICIYIRIYCTYTYILHRKYTNLWLNSVAHIKFVSFPSSFGIRCGFLTEFRLYYILYMQYYFLTATIAFYKAVILGTLATWMNAYEWMWSSRRK